MFAAHQTQHAAAGEAGFCINGCAQRPRRSARLLCQGTGWAGPNTGRAKAAPTVVKIDLRVPARAALKDARFASREAGTALVAARQEIRFGKEPWWAECRAAISDISTQKLSSADALIHGPTIFSI